MLITEVKRKEKFEKSARLNAPVEGKCKRLKCDRKIGCRGRI